MKAGSSPDWARLSGRRLVPIGAPDGTAPVQYGFDAARLPLWLGSACMQDARLLAGRWWNGILSADDRATSLARSLTGQPRDQITHPLPLLAAAAAAASAGDIGRSTSLRNQAAEQSRRTPTYYGDAWLALGGALLDPCHEP
jgi:hypothetical protein